MSDPRRLQWDKTLGRASGLWEHGEAAKLKLRGLCRPVWVAWRSPKTLSRKVESCGQKVSVRTIVQSLSHVWLFVTPWTAAHQASLSITNSWSLLKPMSIASVMPSNHLILCRPLLLLPSIFPRIKVFSNKSVLHIRWPKYWSFSFNISPSNEYSGLIPLGWTGWISLPAKGLSGVFSSATVQTHQFLGTQLSV